MKYFLLLIPIVLMFNFSATAESTIAERCQDNTIVITDGTGHGSGVLFTRTNIACDEVTFVWTVGHIANRVIESNGTFRDFNIVRGDKQAKAIVLRASDNVIDHDIALLQIINGLGFRGDAEFYRPFNHVKVSQSIIHVGTPWNKLHECSVFFGCISYIDRVYDRRHLVKKARFMDQINVTIGGGCSGGGIFDAKTGGILGFSSISTSNAIVFITPTRYIYEWAKSHDCLWAFDREVPLPVDITPWLGDKYRRIILERNHSEIDAWWGELEPELEEVK